MFHAVEGRVKTIEHRQWYAQKDGSCVHNMRYKDPGEVDGKKYHGPPCQKYGKDNHPTQKCHVRYHANNTILHTGGRGESNNEVCPGHLHHIFTTLDIQSDIA
jgi:hypothetical protein